MYMVNAFPFTHTIVQFTQTYKYIHICATIVHHFSSDAFCCCCCFLLLLGSLTYNTHMPTHIHLFVPTVLPICVWFHFPLVAISGKIVLRTGYNTYTYYHLYRHIYTVNIDLPHRKRITLRLNPQMHRPHRLHH